MQSYHQSNNDNPKNLEDVDQKLSKVIKIYELLDLDLIMNTVFLLSKDAIE